MKFKDYIACARTGDDPRGDFIRDARRDARLPDVRTWGELETYLQPRSDPAALDGARAAWNTYCMERAFGQRLETGLSKTG